MGNGVVRKKGRAKLERFNALKAERRAQGLCPDCGAEPALDRVYCAEHLRRYREKWRRRKARSLRDGVCGKCGKPADGTVYCKPCQDRITEHHREAMRRRKAAGLCPKCGAERDAGGLYCTVCLERSSQHMRDRRRRLMKDGLCTRCGQPRKDLAYTTCEDCRAAARERDRASRSPT